MQKLWNGIYMYKYIHNKYRSVFQNNPQNAADKLILMQTFLKAILSQYSFSWTFKFLTLKWFYVLILISMILLSYPCSRKNRTKIVRVCVRDFHVDGVFKLLCIFLRRYILPMRDSFFCSMGRIVSTLLCRCDAELN